MAIIFIQRQKALWLERQYPISTMTEKVMSPFIARQMAFGIDLTVPTKISKPFNSVSLKIKSSPVILMATEKVILEFIAHQTVFGIGLTVQTEVSKPFNSASVKIVPRSVITTATARRIWRFIARQIVFGIFYKAQTVSPRLSSVSQPIK